MQEIEDYMVVIAEAGTAHTAVRRLGDEIRIRLQAGWVPFEGFSHVTIPDGTGGFVHIVMQPMLK